MLQGIPVSREPIVGHENESRFYSLEFNDNASGITVLEFRAPVCILDLLRRQNKYRIISIFN